MSGPVATALALHEAHAVPLAWVVVALFLSGAAAEQRSRAAARKLLVAAWLVFAAFWALQVPHFAFVQKSFIETVGTFVAIPASVYVAVLLWGGRDSLFVLSRAVAVMGLVFMPFQAVPVLRGWLVETVTAQTAFLMSLLGFEPTVLSWSEVAARMGETFGWSAAHEQSYAAQHPDYRNTFFFAEGGQPIVYTILIACTGVGSIAIFAGLIAAVSAPPRRKLAALAVATPVIYGLNLARNVFIGLTFGNQWAHVAPGPVMGLFGTSDPRMVSFFVADRIVAQSLSVVALVAVTYLVVRLLPEVLVVVEDLLYVATGSEWDLAAELDLPVPDGSLEQGHAVRADGTGERE
jgi:archaeosortase A (PGF-CTERM-specific)